MKVLVFTVRPDGTALWLTPEVAKSISAQNGDRLTEFQFTASAVQELLAERLHQKGELRA